MFHWDFSLLISIFAITGYTLWWLSFLLPWRRLNQANLTSKKPEESNQNNASETGVSIIIPFRNEAHRIGPLLQSLNKINGPTNFEILFCDDHSDDNTIDTIENSLPNNCEILKQVDGTQGKKAALMMGILAAKYPIIFTTDADCVVPPNCISQMLFDLERTGSHLALGRVEYSWVNSLNDGKKGRNNLLQVYQQIENQALMAIGFAQSQKQNAAVANGAIMMFNKMAFLALGGYSGNEHIGSGDDIFTLEKFLQSPIHKITYVPHSDAVVSTPLETSYKDFFFQRMRWMKKTFLQKTQKTAFEQVLVGFFMISLWVISVNAVLSAHYETLAFIWLGKLLVDSAGVQLLFTKNKPNIFWVCIASIIQVFWLPILALLAMGNKYSWKNRQYSA